MAFGPNDSTRNPVGMFREVDCGNYFEYDMANNYEEYPATRGNLEEFPHIVWVTTPRDRIDCGYRRALVKKTVMYIVVDEDDNGPVVEKWNIKEARVWNEMPTPGQQLLDKLAA